MDTTPEQAAEGTTLVRVLAAVLERLVGANASLARSDPGQITKFHALKAPGIGVLQYLERIHKYASCSNECFILALIYIDRLIQRNNFLLTELNVHRVVITAILLAAKFFDDAYYNNAYYAKVGGVLVSEMNGLEVDFLFRINFSLHVTPELFQKYRAELVSHSVGAGIIPSPELHASPVLTNSVTRVSPHIAPSHTMTLPIETKTQTLQHTDYGQLPFGSSNRHPMHITPSPPPPTAHPAAPPLQVASVGSGEMMSSLNQEQPCDLTFRASSDTAVVGISQQLSVLQRHNSLPPVAKGLAGALIAAGATPPYSVGGQQSSCSPHPPYSAPTMMPVGVSPPVLTTTPTGAMDSTERYVVVDNVAYPVHGGLVHYQHAPANVDVSGGFHHRANGAVQQTQVGSQRLVNGQMLAG